MTATRSRTSSSSSRRKGGSSARSRSRDAFSAFTHRTDRYARDVLAGKILAGPLVRLACKRHLEDRQLAKYNFDQAAADHAINFFEQVLRLPDTEDDAGEPSPFLLLPWQVFVIGSLFGWRREDGRRRFRYAYIETGKGSGKTPLLAGIGLYGLVLDGEQAAEICAAAVTREQARILWTDAARMVDVSPDLAIVLKSAHSLDYQNSWFRIVSSEHRGLDGKRPHMGLIDELHEHPTGIVVNKIRAGAKRRRQPLFPEITNAGFDRSSICWQHHEHSRRIVEGVVKDDRWFSYVCSLDEGDDPLTQPKCWAKANPGLPALPTVEYLRDQVQAAKNIPAETNTVLRLNFCVWTQASTRAFDPAKWAKSRRRVTDDQVRGRPCYAGLDLGQTDDIAAFALLWDLGEGQLAVRLRYWLPSGAMTRFKDRPYDQWKRSGRLEVTAGNVTDFDVIEDVVKAECQRWGVRELAYDKRFAWQMALHLQGAGVTCTDTPQGYGLNEAVRKLSEVIEAESLATDDDEILAWMADNTVTREGRNKELRLDKEQSREKIDGISALVMALSRYIHQEPRPEPQYQAIVYSARRY